MPFCEEERGHVSSKELLASIHAMLEEWFQFEQLIFVFYAFFKEIMTVTLTNWRELPIFYHFDTLGSAILFRGRIKEFDSDQNMIYRVVYI